MHSMAYRIFGEITKRVQAFDADGEPYATDQTCIERVVKIIVVTDNVPTRSTAELAFVNMFLFHQPVIITGVEAYRVDKIVTVSN